MNDARVKRRSPAKALCAGGGLSIVAGVLWGVLFASVPYQDPTPELQARFALHSTITNWLLATGVFLLALGFVAWLFERRSGRPAPEREE